MIIRARLQVDGLVWVTLIDHIRWIEVAVIRQNARFAMVMDQWVMLLPVKVDQWKFEKNKF